MDNAARRRRLLALVAPGLIALEVAPVPWAVEGWTENYRPRVARAVPGCSPVRVGRLVRDEPAASERYFSTKARSMT